MTANRASEIRATVVSEVLQWVAERAYSAELNHPAASGREKQELLQMASDVVKAGEAAERMPPQSSERPADKQPASNE